MWIEQLGELAGFVLVLLLIWWLWKLEKQKKHLQ
jgi:hypothetical protein